MTITKRCDAIGVKFKIETPKAGYYHKKRKDTPHRYRLDPEIRRLYNSPMNNNGKLGLFSPEDARLFHLMLKIIEMPHYDWMADGDAGGDEFNTLEELLKFELGRYSMGDEPPQERLQRFISTESDAGILTMIQLAPAAVYRVMQEAKAKRSPYVFHSQDDDVKRLDGIIDTLNWWLEQTKSAARFVNGEFLQDGLVDETPKAIKDLPTKEDLLEDIAAILKLKKIVTLVFIDLDNFKAVNDKLSHPDGDRCLEKVVEITGTVIAGKGRLYRYGGDEFAVVLKNFTAQEAATTADRIRSDVDSANPAGSVKVTTSIGVACSNQADLVTASGLLQMADDAVYMSKGGGKNRVSIWDGSTKR